MIAAKGNANLEEESNFILDDLTTILNNIEQSTMATESEDNFNKLFEDQTLTARNWAGRPHSVHLLQPLKAIVATLGCKSLSVMTVSQHYVGGGPGPPPHPVDTDSSIMPTNKFYEKDCMNEPGTSSIIMPARTRKLF